MKRSEINQLITEGVVLFRKMGISLPPQAHWNLETWYEHRNLAEEMRRRSIGWDLTDFGSGDFSKIGMFNYTVSNGFIDLTTSKPADQPYSNKVKIVKEGQAYPRHHHRSKIEDNVVLAGTQFDIELHNVGPNDEVDMQNEVRIMRNNIWESYPPGATITLVPGERVRFEPRHYHRLFVQQGMVAVEEVSSVSDDTDTCWLPEDRVTRYPEIEEDQKPKYLLCSDLPGTQKFDQLVKMYLK